MVLGVQPLVNVKLSCYYIYYRLLFFFSLISCFLNVSALLVDIIILSKTHKHIIYSTRWSKGERGQLAVYFIGNQSFIITFSYSFNNFWDSKWILIGWLIKLSVQTFQPLIVIYRRDNFVYHYWRYTSNYRPLSYPFRSLLINQYL